MAATSRSASSKTIFGDFPPSSNETRVRFFAADAAMRLPVSVAPVKATLSTCGCSTRRAPTPPSPVTTLNTPGGNPASINRFANSIVEIDACSEGLTTKVHPAARPGANLNVNNNPGEFHAVIAATTPTGSRLVYMKKFDRSEGIVSPCNLSARPAK